MESTLCAVGPVGVKNVEEAVKSHCWVTPDIFGAGCPYLTM